MNLNELAKVVAKKESGKKEVSIGQVKEVIKLVSIEMAKDEKLTTKLVKSGARHLKKISH